MGESSAREPLRSQEEVERDREFALRQARLDSHFHAGLLSSDVTFITRLLASFAACDEPFVRAVTLDRYLRLRCYWHYSKADLEAEAAASESISALRALSYVPRPLPPRPPPHERECPEGVYFERQQAAVPLLGSAAAWVGNPLLSQGVQSLTRLMSMSRGTCDVEEAEGLLLQQGEWSSSGRTSDDAHRDASYVAPELQEVVIDGTGVRDSPHLRKRSSSTGRAEQDDSSSSSEQEPLLGV